MDVPQGRRLIVLCGAGRFVGDAINGSLSPAYELNVQIQAGAQGMAVAHIATPVLMLASIDSIPIPADAVTIRVDDLSREEQKKIARAIQIAEEMRAKMQAAQSGVLITREMPR